jgi:hypothetical protein
MDLYLSLKYKNSISFQIGHYTSPQQHPLLVLQKPHNYLDLDYSSKSKDAARTIKHKIQPLQHSQL